MPGKLKFNVIHVSGQDDGHRASELNNHGPTIKGWQAAKFCLYPQDLVVQLSKRSRLKKIQLLSHQFLIATKIEIYVGDVPAATKANLQNARYTRLGYVDLSSNEKTSFKARELKSVHVDAVGIYIKFVIHKNHVNKHNLYNQVGLVAINVIGEEVTDPADPYSYSLDPADADKGQALPRSDYTNPTDDLAFDMYQDPEVAQIIRKLDKKKQEAVLDERYDFAKRLKQVIVELQKVGERLGKYEVDKRKAVENEDYDKAQKFKALMDELRLQQYKELQVHNLLEYSGSQSSQPAEAMRQATPPRLPELSHTPPPPPPPEEEHGRPLTNAPFDEQPIAPAKTSEGDEVQATPRTPYDERTIPALKSSPGAQQEEQEEVAPPIESAREGKNDGGPEEMSERDQREASAVIDVFGMELASKAYSKTWSFREDALVAVWKELSEVGPSETQGEVRRKLKATVQIILKGIKDKILAVYTAALSLEKKLLSEFVPSHFSKSASKSETAYVLEKTLLPLLQRSGDTAQRSRDAAKQFILEVAIVPDCKAVHTVPLKCVEPFKLSIAPRLALSRTEIVDELYRDLGLENSGLSVENVMAFESQALQHTDGKVREQAERTIIDLYTKEGATVKKHLPPDNDKTRKNTLYRQLFEAFDRIDGKPSKADLKKQKLEQEQMKQKEIEALQSQLQQLRNMQAGKTGKKGAEKKGKKPVEKAPAKEKEMDDVSAIYNIDNQCIFCGERNEEFTEEGLDVHYWKNCPMLKRCANCKQVVEVSGLSDHLLTECEAKARYRQCTRCTEAIPEVEFQQHDQDQACPPAEEGMHRCPLCHSNIEAKDEEGWKVHLMGKDGCKQNPRRLPAANKTANTAKGGAGTKAVAKGKSGIPKGGGMAKPTPRK